MRRTNRKVCIIGLDGATFRVLDAWVASGHMPHLGALIARGSRADLISTIPPFTGPAWTSMTTGVNPGLHGVFDFVKWNADGITSRIVQSGDIPVVRFWDLAGEQGRTVGVYKVPITFPACAVNGFMVTGWPTLRHGNAMTHPPVLYWDLAKRDLCPLEPWTQEHSARGFVRNIIHSHRCHEEALTYLLQRYTPDFFMGVFSELDFLQHRFWPYCEREDSGKDRALRSLVAEYFRSLDHTIGYLMGFFGEETTFYVVSDHGFGPADKCFPLNNYLARRGFLALDMSRLWLTLARRNLTAAAQSVLGRLGLLSLAQRLVERRLAWLRGAENRFGLITGPSAQLVDWPRTLACVRSLSANGICVNVRGKSPHGRVSPGKEYERVVRDLKRSLLELKDPISGGRLVTYISRRDEVHHGPFVAEAPDLYVILRHGAVMSETSLGGPLFANYYLKGTHRREGVLIACGPHVKKGVRFDADILDVAPTALYTMGIPVPQAMEGKVLSLLFEQDFVAGHPVERSRHPLDRPGGEPQRFVADERDDENTKAKLRRLGYL